MKYIVMLIMLWSAVFCNAYAARAQGDAVKQGSVTKELNEPVEILPATAIKGDDEPATLLESPEIEIKNTAQPNMNNIGVYSEEALHMPEAIWKETDEQLALQLIQQLPESIVSSTLQRLIYKVLVAATITEFEGRDFVYLRARSLVDMGQLALAKDILDRLPDSLVEPKEKRLAFLIKVISANKDENKEKELCSVAKEEISSSNDPFWQRWITLCQVKEGQKDRASLGLELLREQAALGEFYESMVWSLLGNEPPRTIPEALTLEMIAWLKFADLEKLTFNSAAKEALVMGAGFALETALASKTWPQFADRYAMGSALTKPVEVILPEELAEETISVDLATLHNDKNNWEEAFLIHALRQAIGVEVDEGAVEVLLYHSYPVRAQQLFPGWKKRLAIMAYKGQAAQIIMTLGMLFSKPLEQYNLQDSIHVVELLKLLGMEKEAHMFAIELLEAWKRLPDAAEMPKTKANKVEKPEGNT